MQKDITTKLAKCEADLKRWQTRLKRATAKVTELDRTRRRLQAKMGPVNLTDIIGPPLSAKDVGADQETVKPMIDVDEVKRQVDAAIDTTIPPLLKRSDEPQLVDKLKAKRIAQVEADKHKMPLTGKAALEAVKPKRKKVAAGLRT
jgi:hypothetical protein